MIIITLSFLQIMILSIFELNFFFQFQCHVFQKSNHLNFLIFLMKIKQLLKFQLFFVQNYGIFQILKEKIISEIYHIS